MEDPAFADLGTWTERYAFRHFPPQIVLPSPPLKLFQDHPTLRSNTARVLEAYTGKDIHSSRIASPRRAFFFRLLAALSHFFRRARRPPFAMVCTHVL